MTFRCVPGAASFSIVPFAKGNINRGINARVKKNGYDFVRHNPIPICPTNWFINGLLVAFSVRPLITLFKEEKMKQRF